MITVNNLSKSFTDPNGDEMFLFQDMNLNFSTGSFTALMWQSGRGKTTLLNMIAGLESDYLGSIIIDDTMLETLTDREKTLFRGKHMSYVFQEYNLIETLTVGENIDLIIEINKNARRFSTDDILQKVGLLDKKQSYPFVLSWWEKQRVALARSFVSVTDIILADEPTGSLDEKNAQAVMEILRDLWKDTGVTIIMITHSESMASYAEDVYQLEQKNFKKIVW